MTDVVVMFHGNCPDGFAGAYAAWKKFGESATYLPLTHGSVAPDVTDKEVYCIDFSFSKDVMLKLEKSAKRFVVLDHHEGAREAIEAVQEHVFDVEHSGCAIAWSYFHPGVPMPKLLAHIEDSDLWRHTLPNWKEVGSYLSTLPFSFDVFEKTEAEFENNETFSRIVEEGAHIARYRDYLCEQWIQQAARISLNGKEAYAVQAPRLFNSQMGNMLAQKYGGFGVVWYFHNMQWHFSLRSDGSVDVSEIARTYGGNGHHNAASFRIPYGQPFPFTFL